MDPIHVRAFIHHAAVAALLIAATASPNFAQEPLASVAAQIRIGSRIRLIESNSMSDELRRQMRLTPFVGIGGTLAGLDAASMAVSTDAGTLVQVPLSSIKGVQVRIRHTRDSLRKRAIIGAVTLGSLGFIVDAVTETCWGITDCSQQKPTSYAVPAALVGLAAGAYMGRGRSETWSPEVPISQVRTSHGAPPTPAEPLVEGPPLAPQSVANRGGEEADSGAPTLGELRAQDSTEGMGRLTWQMSPILGRGGAGIRLRLTW